MKAFPAWRPFTAVHQGRRAFIIGNGPSLARNGSLRRFAADFTFGLNRIYLMFAALGFATSCLVSVNDLVVQQCVRDMQGLAIPRSFRGIRIATFASRTPGLHDLPTFVYSTYESPRIRRDAAGRLWEGATVTYVALQLAFHMGFQQVILIGVDHHFTTQGEANKTVVSDGEDPNHFSPATLERVFVGSCLIC